MCQKKFALPVQLLWFNWDCITAHLDENISWYSQSKLKSFKQQKYLDKVYKYNLHLVFEFFEGKKYYLTYTRIVKIFLKRAFDYNLLCWAVEKVNKHKRQMNSVLFSCFISNFDMKNTCES